MTGIDVAFLTIHQISREKDLCEVVRRASESVHGVVILELLTSVDLVDHHLHVDRISGVGILNFGIVTLNADFDFQARATVQGQRIVAAVTGLGDHNVARRRIQKRRHLPLGGQEIEKLVLNIAIQIDFLDARSVGTEQYF